jgi:hypothetical protein
MHFQGVGFGWRSARLMLVVFVQAILLSAVSRADVVNAGNLGVTDAGSHGGLWFNAAFTATRTILRDEKMGRWWMPTSTNLNFTVTCGPVAPEWPDIASITIDFADSQRHENIVDTSGKTGISWSTGPIVIESGAYLSITVVYKNKNGTGTTSLNAYRTFLRPTYDIAVKPFGDSNEYPNSRWRGYLDQLTTAQDIFNLTFRVHVVQASRKSPSEYVPAGAGVQVMVWYPTDSYPSSPWKSKWIPTDSKGEALVSLGTGAGPTLDVQAGTTAPALYLSVEPRDKAGTSGSLAYIRKTCVLPQFAKLAGWLEVLARDTDGNALRAKVTAWGGPFLAGADNASGVTNELGFKELEINPNNVTTGRETVRYTAKVVPVVKMEFIYTQLIDRPADLVEEVPFFISPRYTLHPDAYSYTPKTGGMTLFCNGGRLELRDDASGNLLQELPIRVGFFAPKNIGRQDRKFLPVPVTREKKVYQTRVVFDDTDGVSDDGKLVASETPLMKFLIQATREQRKPAYTVEFVACSVGAWSRGNVSYRMRNVPELSQLQQASFSEMFPGTLIFTTGAVLEPSFWPWDNGPRAITSLSLQLQERQRASGVDKVIGLVPPNWIDDLSPGFLGGTSNPGLQIEGINGAAMIDLSKAHVSSSLHEFLHTFDLLDVYNGEYLGVADNLPPSADGYRKSDRQEIRNIMGAHTQTARVMYGLSDHSTPPWLHEQEYNLLMDLVYKSPADSFKESALAADPKAVPGPRMRLHGHFNKARSEAVLDPVFTDVGEAHNPYPTSAPPGSNAFFVELTVGYNQYERYYIPDKAPLLRVSPAVGQTTHAVEIPMDSQFSALFDFSIPADPRITEVRLGYMGSGAVSGIWESTTIAPIGAALNWVSAPSGMIGEPASFEWRSTNPLADANVADIVDANEFFVSSDGGNSWKQAANSIAWRAMAGAVKHAYYYRFNPADWPSGNRYRFKVLATANGCTTQLVTAQDVTVAGYNPNPEAELLIEKWEARRPETGRFTVVVPLRNNGREMLEVTPDTATLPAWLMPAQSGPVKIYPLCDGVLLLAGAQNATGTFSRTITLNTNDPVTPKLTLPVTLVQEGPAAAPQIALIALNPDYPDVRPWQPGETVRVTLWDNGSRPTLQAFLTIARTSPNTAELVKDLPMDPGSLPGEHIAEWTIPAEAVDGQYGLAFTLRDPATELDSTDDSHALTVKRFTSIPGEGKPLFSVLRGFQVNFSAADADQSGGLSLEETQAQPPELDANTFNALDANRDGHVVPTELQLYFEGKSNLIARNLDTGFTAADADHSGGLSLGEAQTQTPELDASIFNTLDANHDIQLTQAELQQYLHPDEGEGEGEGEGEPEGEGEGEIEGEQPSHVAQTLNDNFSAADTDQSGGLSLAEAQSQIPGLDAGTFNTLDANHDSQLTLAELEQYLGASPSGCNCSSTKGAFDLKRRLGDLLLAGVSLMVIVLMSRKVG